MSHLEVGILHMLCDSDQLHRKLQVIRDRPLQNKSIRCKYILGGAESHRVSVSHVLDHVTTVGVKQMRVKMVLFGFHLW